MRFVLNVLLIAQNFFISPKSFFFFKSYYYSKKGGGNFRSRGETIFSIKIDELITIMVYGIIECCLNHIVTFIFFFLVSNLI